MRHFKQLLPVLSLSVLIFASCQKESSIRQEATIASLEDKIAAASPARLKEHMAQWVASVPPDFAQKLNQQLEALPTFYTEPWNKFRRSLNASAVAPCNENTPWRQWMAKELSDWTPETKDLSERLDLWNLVFLYAYFYESNTASQYFGVDGDYTQKLQKAFKDLRRFWGFQSIEVQMVALHGNILLNADKTAAVIRYLDRSKEEARALAEQIAVAVRTIPAFRKGDHPSFSDNAIAFFQNESPVGPLPYKILMGDGMLEGFAALGYGDVAPQAILGHEFGHIIEFSLDIYANVPDAEITRRFELLADAFSAYYLSHARGASMQWKRAKQFFQVFFNIGDCSVDLTGHHGTPSQRMAAAEWAYTLANKAQKQGHIMNAEEFVTLFDAALPEIVSH